MHEKRFDGGIEKLRSPERVARLEVERVVDLCLAGAEIKSVLDVGTGSGLFAEAFFKRGVTVAGIDANPDMLPVARGYVPKADFRQAEAEQLPYPDDSFDLVFMGLLLHESDEPIKVLQETYRVTRQRVCILEWPYIAGEFGPPLMHRVKPADLAMYAQQAAFKKILSQELSNLTLYQLTK
jgi:ubiquinone/menaquinone biosynthesis C-methylase UbiE